MNKKNIHMKWFLGGVLLLLYAAFVIITGKFLIHGSYRSLFLDEKPEPFYYYLNLYGSLIIGILYLYRSLLFIPSNRKFYDEHPEYLRKRAEYQRAQLEISPGRLIKITLVILLIFGLIMMAAKFL